ncbi:hypothetical protein [Marinobacter sp.]|uniref:hypothetical protein n=1 Tax=Marinobacter sp. TaxID=50741 RepID=UPI00384AA527
MSINKRTAPPSELSGVLYLLHSMPDVYDADRYQKIKRGFEELYDSKELLELKNATEWALENPEFDFRGYADVRQNQEQIVHFLGEMDQLLRAVNQLKMEKDNTD